MTRVSMVLQLKHNDYGTPEGVNILAKDNKWKSPDGGWLGTQDGVWDQMPGALYLFDGAHKVQVADLRGCNFFLNKEPDSGQALYGSPAGGGTWTVIAHVDS